MLNKKLSLLLCFALVFIMLITACQKPNEGDKSSSVNGDEQSQVADVSKNSGSTSLSQSNSANLQGSLSSVSREDGSFEYSFSDSKSNSYVEPSEETKAQYAELYAVYKIAELDGSYSGADSSVGFPSRIARSSSTFTTYPVGYGEGTTGGRGAQGDNVYVCSTGAQILSALESITAKLSLDANTKSIIKVSGTITEENTGATQIVVNSVKNFSIIGEGTLGVFDGVGLNFKSSENIIVQNLTIHHPSKNYKNEKDCLELNDCRYAWVDHCEFYNDYPSNSSEKDYYDGLCDVKNQSSNITISYNYLHDAWKTSLVGSGSSDLYDGRTITYHHNIFKNCNSRLPLLRGGYTHIYNNYYENINTGINCRIGAQAFIENNVFVNVKNPICSIEETIGYWNAEGNTFTSCSGSGQTNDNDTTNYTPSYEYILDTTINLKSYLESTVGVGKIDLNVACSAPANREQYQVPKQLVIAKGISELPTIALNNNVLQRLIYLSREVLFSEESVVSSISNLSQLMNCAREYIALYASDLDSQITSVNTSGVFSDNATLYYAVYDDYTRAESSIKTAVTKTAQLQELTSYYTSNFVTKFNAEVDSYLNAGSEKMPQIEKLLALYDRSSDKPSLKYEQLQLAYMSSYNHVKAEEFEQLCSVLPSASSVTLADRDKVTSAKNAFEALTNGQYALVSQSALEKYTQVKLSFDALASASQSMDLSGISVGTRTPGGTLTPVGSFKLGASVDIKSANVSFGGETFKKAVFISGYGNTGGKCINFTVYETSDVTLVLNSETGACKIKLCAPDKTVIDSYVTQNNSIVTVTFKAVAQGDYFIFTDIPDGTVITDSKIFVYSATITPN